MGVVTFEDPESGQQILVDTRSAHLRARFQDAASELLYPVLPLFLTSVLGAPVAVVGLIEGIAEGTASAMKAVSGWLARRRNLMPQTEDGLEKQYSPPCPLDEDDAM